MSSSMKKVCATGAGSARPVVSMITRSNASRPGFAPLPQIAEDTNQVAAHGAADATIVHLDDLLLAAGNQNLVVDACLAELVLDDRDPLAVPLVKDAVEQRGLSGAEEAGEDRHRHLFRLAAAVIVLSLHHMGRANRADAKRLASSCSRVVTPLATSSFSAALSHCS